MASFAHLYGKYPSLAKFEDDDYKESHDGREARLLEYLQQRADFAQLQNNPPQLLAAMDEYAAQHEFLISVGSDKARVLADLLATERPRTLVELGGYVGYSAILFAHELRRLGVAGAHVWSLEFEPAFARIIEEIVAIAGLSEMVTVVTGSADASLRELKASGRVQRVDWLFLDHVEDLYVQDFQVAESVGLLGPGACVVADNVVVPGAPQYRALVRAHPGLSSRGLPGLIIPGELKDEFEVSKVLDVQAA